MNQIFIWEQGSLELWYVVALSIIYCFGIFNTLLKWAQDFRDQKL